MLKSITVLTSVASRAAPWLRQTSTITGISTCIGLIVAIFTGEMTWPMALPVAAGALAAMLLPGHPEAQAMVTRVAVDAAALANPQTRADGLKALGRDMPDAVTVAVSARESGP